MIRRCLEVEEGRSKGIDEVGSGPLADDTQKKGGQKHMTCATLHAKAHAHDKGPLILYLKAEGLQCVDS